MCSALKTITISSRQTFTKRSREIQVRSAGAQATVDTMATTIIDKGKWAFGGLPIVSACFSDVKIACDATKKNHSKFD